MVSYLSKNFCSRLPTSDRKRVSRCADTSSPLVGRGRFIIVTIATRIWIRVENRCTRNPTAPKSHAFPVRTTSSSKRDNQLYPTHININKQPLFFSSSSSTTTIQQLPNNHHTTNTKPFSVRTCKRQLTTTHTQTSWTTTSQSNPIQIQDKWPRRKQNTHTNKYLRNTSRILSKKKKKKKKDTNQPH